LLKNLVSVSIPPKKKKKRRKERFREEKGKSSEVKLQFPPVQTENIETRQKQVPIIEEGRKKMNIRSTFKIAFPIR
jgi:activator of HSP90 ATPase